MVRIILILMIITSFFSCNSDKIGYVESDVLLIKYHKTKIAAEEIEKNTSLLRARFDTLKMELDEMQDGYPNLILNKSEEEITNLQNKISKKREEVNRYFEIMSNKIKEEDEKATKRILLEINEVVKKYGKQNGYSFILGATTSGNIVYADTLKNVTNEVLQKLNGK